MQKFIWPLARQFIAGEDINSAATTIERLVDQSRRVTLAIVDEKPCDRMAASETMRGYQDLCRWIVEREFVGSATLSVKLTGLGMLVDPALAYGNLRRVLDVAEPAGVLVRIDMEHPELVEPTVEFYAGCRDCGYNMVGLVLQASDERSSGLLGGLSYPTGNVRVCKGAYGRSAHLRQRQERDREAFKRLIDQGLKMGWMTASATHDRTLVRELGRRIMQGGDAYRHEFQMLLGVKPRLGDEIVALGQPLRVYVPIGRDWAAYCVRRLRERPLGVGKLILGM